MIFLITIFLFSSSLSFKQTSRFITKIPSISRLSLTSIFSKSIVTPEIGYDSRLALCNDYDDDDHENESDTDGRMNSADRNDDEWMFFDTARINVKGGDGGDGCMAMQREFKIEFGGPSGGNGGNGGTVYLQCDKGLNTLSLLHRRVHHRAGHGTNGKGDSRHGTRGADTIVLVPPGTIVRDSFGTLAGELNKDGQRLLVAKGGKGGRGNEHFKTARMNAPSFAEKGEPGAERWIHVELKLIADVGLVGIPNAGKSTLLAASTNANPKIAAYPFTTVAPSLGVCDLYGDSGGSSSSSGSSSLVLADIPGLLEGAHNGVGLGIAFLRHIQRCRVIIHVINGDSDDPIGDFHTVNQELLLFNPKLAEKIQVVVVNKVDIPSVRAKVDSIMKRLRTVAGHTRVMCISAVTGENVMQCMQRVHRLVRSLPEQAAMELFTEEEDRVNFEEETDDKFEVITDDKYPNQFRVVGSRIEKAVKMTNWNFYEATRRFQRILEAQGISAALRKSGAVQGDLVMIGDLDFNYWEPKNRWISDLGLEEVNPRLRDRSLE